MRRCFFVRGWVGDIAEAATRFRVAHLWLRRRSRIVKVGRTGDPPRRLPAVSQGSSMGGALLIVSEMSTRGGPSPKE